MVDERIPTRGTYPTLQTAIEWTPGAPIDPVDLSEEDDRGKNRGPEPDAPSGERPAPALTVVPVLVDKVITVEDTGAAVPAKGKAKVQK